MDVISNAGSQPVKLNVQLAGSGPALVWAHGLTSSIAREDRTGAIDWSKLLNTVRLIRYDARGHGESQSSPDPADYRWSSLAQDMLAVADALGLGSFIAGGGSMGCATALYAALQAPQRIRAMVLSHPPTAWETRSAKAHEYEELAASVEKTSIAALVEQARQQPMTPAWWFEAHPEYVTAYLDQLSGSDPRQMALLWRGAGLCNLPERETLRSLSMPALVLAWEGDPGHPLSTAEELDRLLPQARLVIARNTQELDGWTEEIRDFLKCL